jgi:tRNA A37 threonylcarbamoyladenosine modification protein TsaB
VAVCQHAREDDYYFACYTDDGTQLPVAGITDRIVTSKEIHLIVSSYTDLILTGPGWLEPALASLTESCIGFADLPPPDASVLCELAVQALEAGLGLSDPELILPVYLKDEMAYRTA